MEARRCCAHVHVQKQHRVVVYLNVRLSLLGEEEQLDAPSNGRLEYVTLGGGFFLLPPWTSNTSPFLSR